MAIVVEKLHPGIGKRHANRAAVFSGICGVATCRRRRFAQAITLQNWRTGFFAPQLGHSTLNRGASASGAFQVAPIDQFEVGVVGHAIEQGVHGRHDVDLVF